MLSKKIKNSLDSIIKATTTVAVAVSLSAAVSGCNLARHVLPLDTQIIETSELTINEDDSIMNLTLKSEIEGIKDLEEKITANKNSAHEEAWICLPEVNKWYEIGIMRMLENRQYNDAQIFVSGIRISKPRINQIIEDNPGVTEFVFYHNHPTGKAMYNAINNLPLKSIYADFYKPEEEQPKKETHYNTRELIWNLFQEKSEAKVSISDLRAMLYYIDYFKEKSPEYFVREGIASYHGITAYLLTENGVNHLEDIDEIDHLLKGEIKTKQTDKEIAIETDYLTIRFMPYEEVYKHN